MKAVSSVCYIQITDNFAFARPVARNGLWRSWEHFHGMEEVDGSNPSGPPTDPITRQKLPPRGYLVVPVILTA